MEVSVTETAVSRNKDGQGTAPLMMGGSRLTRREIDVLRLLALGLTDREIAATLSISRKTASNHVHNLLQKAGVSTRTGAVSLAARTGLI